MLHYGSASFTDLCCGIITTYLWTLLTVHAVQRWLTVFISEHFSLSAEHGFQHGVLSGQHLQRGVKQVPADVESDILVAQAHRPSITAGLGLGTGQRRGRGGAARLSVMMGQAAVPRHVPLEVDDHPADGGPKVPRRGDSYWWGRHNLSLLQIIPGTTQSFELNAGNSLYRFNW